MKCKKCGSIDIDVVEDPYEHYARCSYCGFEWICYQFLVGL